MTLKTCACGCGKEVKGRGVYFHGHRPKDTIEDVRGRKCACGCGGDLPEPRNHSSRYYRAQFLRGHATRLIRPGVRSYVPSPDEIPSGVCECGCGKPTPVATRTVRSRRIFRGHPMPLLHGHHRYVPLTERKKFIGRRIYLGYAYVYRPEHPRASKSKTMAGYIREHRVVWEEANGRMLDRKEVVHHVNGDKLDNRPENLVAMSNADHRRLHSLGHEVSPETRRKNAEATRRAWAEGRMEAARVKGKRKAS